MSLKRTCDWAKRGERCGARAPRANRVVLNVVGRHVERKDLCDRHRARLEALLGNKEVEIE